MGRLGIYALVVLALFAIWGLIDGDGGAGAPVRVR